MKHNIQSNPNGRRLHKDFKSWLHAHFEGKRIFKSWAIWYICLKALPASSYSVEPSSSDESPAAEIPSSDLFSGLPLSNNRRRYESPWSSFPDAFLLTCSPPEISKTSEPFTGAASCWKARPNGVDLNLEPVNPPLDCQVLSSPTGFGWVGGIPLLAISSLNTMQSNLRIRE